MSQSIAQSSALARAENGLKDAAEAAAFLASGGRIAVLVGDTQADRSALLDEVMGRVQGPAVLVGNKLNAPLTLHRVLFQAGAVGTEADKGAALLRSLSKLASQGRIVLAVNDAQTLTPDALTVLIHTITTARFECRLVLLGLPSLLHAAAAPNFEALRDPTVTWMGGAALPPFPARSVRRARLRWAWPIRLGAVLVASIGVVGGWLSLNTRPEDARTPDVAAAVSPSPQVAGHPAASREPDIAPTVAPIPDPVVAVPNTGLSPPPDVVIEPAPAPPTPPEIPAEPQPARDTTEPNPAQPAHESRRPVSQAPVALDEARVRRSFNAFLNRAGQDTAALSTPARAALFKDYLAWRSQHPDPD